MVKKLQYFVVLVLLSLGVGLAHKALKSNEVMNASQTPPPNICLQNCPPQKPMHIRPQATAVTTENIKLSDQLDLEQVDLNLISLLVEKGKGNLTLFYDRQPIKTYPIALGSSPTGDKQKEGDRKTPEGLFSIRDKYPHPEWSKFLWLDYPTPESWRKHLEAKRLGQIEADATVGGEVGIHGVPAGKDHFIDQGTNWTLGCVSLKNDDINEIYEFVQKGTPVEIML